MDENHLKRFMQNREGSGIWAGQPALLAAWKEGRLLDVPPLTLEYSMNEYFCTLQCGDCPYSGVYPADAWDGRLPPGEFVPKHDIDDKRVASLDTAKLVLEKARDAGVTGVLHTGGREPTACEHLIPAIRHSADLGMVNALYTNGINIGVHPDRAKEILDPLSNLVFVRQSQNFVSLDVGKEFSRATKEDIKAQLSGLEALFRARSEWRSEYSRLERRLPSIQVSVICDQRNVNDLGSTLREVAAIAGRYSAICSDQNDGVVVRPLTKHCQGTYSVANHPQWVIDNIQAECTRGNKQRGVDPGQSFRALEEAHMNLYMGFGLQDVDDGVVPSYEDGLNAEYAAREHDPRCWANGVFLTVSVADVYLCVDRNCYPDWAVGSLRDNSVREVYHSEKRRALLERVECALLGPTECEPTCRAVRLNRIAKAIRSGELTNQHIDHIWSQSINDRKLLLS